ncbi:hypothetical protein BROUX41_003881 [Berkeleyomyces rouxiae]|uniref:uncharacterized protein n=1 Tax=Berkeleyomyces rouxiae TaxID=2035830 RepID=UPI003B7D750A
MSRFRHSWSSDHAPTGPIHVSSRDYSYITPQDVDKDDLFDRSSDSLESPEPDDDVIFLVFGDKKQRTCFPPYSIADGKVCVHDLRTRAGILFNINGKPLQSAHLKYKGRILGGEDEIVRQFSVKNKSEISITLTEGDESRHKKSKSKKKTRSGNDSDVADHPIPSSSSRAETSKAQPTKPLSPIDQINSIEEWFDTELLDMCQVFMKTPPADSKKREQEWRRLTETTMQHVTLKLDGIDHNGNDAARSRRKEVHQRIEGYMRMLDEAKKK